MRILLVAILSLMLCAGCSARRGEAVSEPLNVDNAKLARAANAFIFYCNKCHPVRDKGLGMDIDSKPLPGFMIKAQVRAGAGVMPAFSQEQITGEELEEIVDYILLLSGSPPLPFSNP